MSYFILAITIHLVLTVLLFVLTWEYPAASLLRSVFLIYEMICLVLWLYGKKRDSAEAPPPYRKETHGKCFVIDDRLCAIGSFNWDMRSTYIDTELMLVIDSEALNAILREEMESYEESALTVIDTDTSIVPNGMQAQEVSSGKMVLLRIVNLFYWIRFLM